MTAKIKNQDIAYAFLDQKDLKKDILFCSGWDTFFIYEDGYYKMYDPEEFRELVWRFIIENYSDISTTTSLIKDIVAQIKWASYRKVITINPDYLAFKDKLYNINKFKWEEFDKQKIALHRIEFESKEINMDIPKFENFLRTTLVDETGKTDKQLILLVQQMFGHYLTNSLKGEMAFFLIGNGSNGKSVMSKIIKAMIGEKYASAISIEKLTINQFAASGLIGKKINICNEEESKYLKSDRFKALVTNDIIQTERKFENQFSFEPTTKFLFSSNRMPNFEGLNYGLRRRLTIIPFNKIFIKKEKNIHLFKELMDEMPGIINWAIDGARMLKEDNYNFVETKATNQTKIEFEDNVSSSIMFFREHFVSNDDGFIANEAMYREYVNWCIDNGKKPMASVGFHRDISQNLKIKKVQKWENNKNNRGIACSRRVDEMPEDMRRLDDALKNDTTTKSIEQDSIIW